MIGKAGLRGKSWLSLKPGLLTFMKCWYPNMPSTSPQTTGVRGILEIAGRFSLKPLPSLKYPCSSPALLEASQRPSENRRLGKEYKLHTSAVSPHEGRSGLVKT